MATTSRYNTLEFCPIIPLEFLWVLLEFEYSEAGIPVGMSFRSESVQNFSNYLQPFSVIYRAEIPTGILSDSARNPLEDVGECKDLKE